MDYNQFNHVQEILSQCIPCFLKVLTVIISDNQIYESVPDLEYINENPQEKRATRSILIDENDKFGVSAVSFDSHEELLWMGNQGSRVTSYYGLNQDKYSSFQIHHSEEIKCFSFTDAGVLCLTESLLRCQARTGRPLFTFSDEELQNKYLCMMHRKPDTVFLGGHHCFITECDLTKMTKKNKLHIPENSCGILRQHSRFLCAGDSSGQILLLDPHNLNLECKLDCYAGSLLDFDIYGNYLVTCGLTERHGNLIIDPFLKVYDIRILKAINPIQILIDPFLIRFIPSISAKVAVVSPIGQMQIVDMAALIKQEIFLYQVYNTGAMCLAFDVSSTCQHLAFGDASGYIHVFSFVDDAPFNTYSQSTVFPDEDSLVHSIPIDDILTPLSSVIMPFSHGPLLSDWPKEFSPKAYRKTPEIDPSILYSMKIIQSIGYSPKPHNKKRNQVPYKLDKDKHKKLPASEFHSSKDDGFSFSIPKRYRKVEIKYTKLGIEDSEFDICNRTNFPGLEGNLPNSYCNSMLHASNFLRAFRTLPEASALGLILTDNEESKRKVNFCQLIQSWNTFVLHQVESEFAEKQKKCNSSCSEKKAETKQLLKESNEEGMNSGTENLLVHDSFNADSSKASNSSEGLNIITELFGAMQQTITECGNCKDRKVKLRSTLLYNLIYPDSGENHPNTWLPLHIQMKLEEDGKLSIRNSREDDDERDEASEDKNPWLDYDLTGVVCHIADPKYPDKNNLVSCIRVGSSYHFRFNCNPMVQWYLFNDFSITPICPEESVCFPLDWKTPCVLYWCKRTISLASPSVEKNPITADVFREDKSLAQKSLLNITFIPLNANEMPKKGELVAIDAEFVSLNQEEAVVRSDGTLSTIKPSQMSVARITCIRGQGAREGVPFIDDYISTQEQVVDYLTRFSGIQPGDLDANCSSKHLTTLKSTYLKLRWLIDVGVVFVGHGLKNDFRVINISVPSEQIIDTVSLFHLPHQRMVSLRFLAWHFLNMKIQAGNHDSIEDARAALKLYKKHQELLKEGVINEKLIELYEIGKSLQWKVPGVDEF